MAQLRLDLASRGGATGGRPLKVSLFTDTLADVNGVCRFIRDMARVGLEAGRDFEVLTSTNKACPEAPNIRNFHPLGALKIPRYDELDLVLPPLVPMLRHIDRRQPDVIHVSTPGPVGMVGVLAAKMLGAPLVGVYHTDFPAYVDRLFNDRLMTSVTEGFMRLLYGPFRRVLTRSHDYAESLEKMGMDRAKILPLFPGVNVEVFHPRHRDTRAWAAYPGVSGQGVKALYCGRISVEKGLPRLVEVWKEVHDRCRRRAVTAELLVVGGGPYREGMEQALAGHGAHFLGYRHAEELSRIYASSDLLLFPSRTDTLGQVVVESQASGVPAIVTDEGGPKEVVADGITGHVIPAHEVGRWIDAAVLLLCDDETRTRLGRAAHQRMQRFSQRASFDKFWQAHLEAWEEQTAGAAPSAPTPAADNARTRNEPRMTF